MKLPFKVNEREKKFLLIGGAVLLLILLYHGFSLYSEFRSNVVELADAKRFMLEKQLQKLSRKDVVESRISEVREQLEKQENMFLRGSKPPVAAAILQRFLKEEISSLDLEVRQERTLSPVDADVYLGIPVEIGFKASTEKLKKFLYSLRSARYLLTVSELKIRVTNISNPVDVYVTVVVTGYIKKPAESEEGKNAA